MKTKLLLLLLSPLIFLSTAFAVNRPGAFTLTLGEAYYHFAPKRHLDNIGMPNAALAYNFNEHWAVEAGAGLINTDQRNFDQKGVHGFLYTFDGIYRIRPLATFAPYVAFGVGIISLDPNGNDSVSQANINAGLGSQWFIDHSIAFRGEIRDVYTMRGGKNDVMVNFGVSFLMGGETQPVNYKGA